MVKDVNELKYLPGSGLVGTSGCALCLVLTPFNPFPPFNNAFCK